MEDYYRLILSDKAEQDIQDAVQWYDSQRKGWGFEFAYCLEERLEMIAQFPYMYPIVYKNARKALIRKFPYVVLYYIEEANKTVCVFPVVSTHRSSGIWRRRI